MPPVIAAARGVKIIKKGISYAKKAKKASVSTQEGVEAGSTGVRNAQVRYREHSRERGTAAHIAEKIKNRKRKDAPHTRRVSQKQNNTSHEHAISKEIQQHLEKEGLEFLTEEIRNKSAKKEPLTPFPYIMFTLAVIKDIIDALSLTLIGMLLTKPLSLIIALILFFWFLGKMSGKWWKGRMVGWLWKRYIMAMAVEVVGEVIPATTILVLMAHFRETKTIKVLNGALESLHSAKFKFDLT